MKYTATQKFRQRNSKMYKQNRRPPFVPEVKIKDGFYIVESKMNYDDVYT